jgi:hypothetical protein
MDCDLSSLSLPVLGVLLANEALEYWLGKTDKVKSGSKLEIIVNVVKAILAWAKGAVK